jgi:hypothetical protein
MKSITTRFKETKHKIPYLADTPIFLLCLINTDKPRLIRKHFNKCVSENDYERSEKEQIIKDLLFRLSYF